MKKILILLALIAVAALFWHARQPPKQIAAIAHVVRSDVAEILSEEGKTRLKARYRITSPIAGHLRRITLEPGDTVTRGQILAEIDPVHVALLDARSHEQAQADLAAAEAELTAARQRLQAAAAADTLATRELERLQPLVKSGAASREQLDRARAEQHSHAATHAARQAEIRVAEARITAARAQLQPATTPSTPPLAIRAPIDGTIIQRELESAQPVSAGQLLMDIGDPHALEIEAEILSADAARLAPGMDARILRWGGEALAAHIRRIEPGGFTKTSALGVEEQRTRVILAIDSAHELWQTLGDGYRVDVEITTRRVENTLAIPPGALFRHDNGWAVYRLDADNRAELHSVTPGLTGENQVQIVHGLTENDRVILQPDSNIHPGSLIDVSANR